ncbi:hypothetical protein, partial [Aeromonas caviae]
GDVSALRIRVFTLAGMAVQLRRNTHIGQKQQFGSCNLGAVALPELYILALLPKSMQLEWN